MQYAVAAYTRRTKTGKHWKQLDRFRWVFAHRVDGETRVPVEFLGVWDTVKAAGILRWDAEWPYTRNLANVRKVRHAVSIDEYRRPYRDYLAGKDAKAKVQPSIYEVWFAGVHSDVGGTFEDDLRLAKISLKWMAQGAHANGVLMKAGPYRTVCASVTEEHAKGRQHRMGPAWRLLGYQALDPGRGAAPRQRARSTGSRAGPGEAARGPEVGEPGVDLLTIRRQAFSHEARAACDLPRQPAPTRR